MIISAILLANGFITYDYYEQITANDDRCTISGIVNNIELKEVDYNSCSQSIQFEINGLNGIYKFDTWLIISDKCVPGTQIFNSEGPIPQIGDQIDYLLKYVDEKYSLVSSTKMSQGVYKITDIDFIDGPGTVSGDFKNCIPTEAYTKTTETINYSDGYNLNISTTDSGKKIMFINGNPQLEVNILLKSANFAEIKLASTKNGNENIIYIDNIVKQLKTEKLLEVYSKFIQIDFDDIFKYKDFFDYLGNKIGVEIYDRYL